MSARECEACAKIPPIPLFQQVQPAIPEPVQTANRPGPQINNAKHGCNRAGDAPEARPKRLAYRSLQRAEPLVCQGVSAFGHRSVEAWGRNGGKRTNCACSGRHVASHPREEGIPLGRWAPFRWVPGDFPAPSRHKHTCGVIVEKLRAQHPAS